MKPTGWHSLKISYEARFTYFSLNFVKLFHTLDSEQHLTHRNVVEYLYSYICISLWYYKLQFYNLSSISI